MEVISLDLSSECIYLNLQDCEELSEWVQEKNITAQDETYRSAKTVHSKWTRHQAFEAEIASNKDRLFRIQLVHNLFLYFYV
jgi:spectrin beta